MAAGWNGSSSARPTVAPVLFTHLDYGLIRWPAPAEAAARSIGLRIVVPVRAGYGRSDLHARGTDHLTGVTLDYAAVLDHLRLRDVAVITLGADLRFAVNLSILRPDLVTGILGCAAQFPCARPRNTNAWTSGSASSWPMPATRQGPCPSWCRPASRWPAGWARKPSSPR